MRTIPAGFLGVSLDDLQVCIRVVRRDGEVIRGTESDVNIVIATGDYAGTYYAATAVTSSDVRLTSDLSVSNLEIAGALTPLDASTADLTVLDLTAYDLKAGLFDNAECTVFLVNASDPELYQHVLTDGWIGNTVRTAEGAYRTEFRGLQQALSQGIVRTVGVSCDAELGDDRCKVNLAGNTVNGLPITLTNTVTAVTSRRQFQIQDSIGTTQVVGGKVTFNTGANAGYRMEIKAYSSLQITLYQPMPADIEIGDTFTLVRGCDKTRSTCIDVYDNINNHRAPGTFVPGDFEILKVGKR